MIQSLTYARPSAAGAPVLPATPASAARLTTYGSIAVHMNVMARHVAFVMSNLTEEESAKLPWHRVVSADARISPNMEAATAKKQRQRLKKEGMKIKAAGYIQDADAHFHVVGIRRNIRWSEVKDDEP